MNKLLTGLGAAALAASALAAPAAAQDEQTSVGVRIADLDLSNPSAAARLDLRLRNAAREVCGEADARDLRFAEQTAACQKAAIARAKSAVALAMRGGGGHIAALRTE